jgi:hypothetical protein
MPVPLTRADVTELHCITPMVNVPSITLLGILSNQRAESVHHMSIAMEEIQARRAERRVPNARTLHEYANLYIDARNPMMYRRKAMHLKCCVLRVSPAVLDLPNVVVADGNAASDWTRFGPSPSALGLIDRDLVRATYWNQSYESKRVRSAEILVPDWVPPEHVTGAYVSCEEALASFNGLKLTEPRLQATIKAHLFYL